MLDSSVLGETRPFQFQQENLGLALAVPSEAATAVEPPEAAAMEAGSMETATYAVRETTTPEMSDVAYAVVEATHAMAETVVDNIAALLAGRRPPNIVNPEVLAS